MKPGHSCTIRWSVPMPQISAPILLRKRHSWLISVPGCLVDDGHTVCQDRCQYGLFRGPAGLDRQMDFRAPVRRSSCSWPLWSHPVPDISPRASAPSGADQWAWLLRDIRPDNSCCPLHASQQGANTTMEERMAVTYSSGMDDVL